MENDEVVTVAQSAEDLAAEEAAFATAFTETRGETEPEPVVPLGDGETVNEEVVEPVVPVEPTPATAPAPKLIGGLTEEQLTAALARNATLQGSVDKMAGRMGQLMQQIEALRATPPTTQAAQVALDLKLEKLSGSFPELANLLREDLQGLQSAQAAAPAPAAPAGITQEQMDAMFAERLGSTTAKLTEQMEVKILSIQHPDWLQVIQTPQFAVYRDNVLPAGVGKQLMESEDSAFISKKLTEFKAWQVATATPVADPAPAAMVTPIRKTRLANAVLPSGSGSAVNVVETEDDAFAAGFKKERAKGGY